MAAPDHEDQTMVCKSCGTALIARTKKYEGFEDKLQWQNENGTAHYKFAGPGKFNCNIPTDNNDESVDIGNVIPKPAILKDDIDVINEKITKLTGICDEILRIVSEKKLGDSGEGVNHNE